MRTKAKHKGLPIYVGVLRQHKPARTADMSKAVVITEIKLKQNKRKTMFCFSEIVLFQFYFSFISDVTTV